MTTQTTGSASPEKTQRLLEIFGQMLPLVDGLAHKLRFSLILGGVLAGWIFVWLFFLKHISLGSTLVVVGVVALPLLVILRFWWALEELKGLPDIAGQMMGDAQHEISATVQGVRAGNAPKLGLLGATKGLWSVGAMAAEARDLVGSYISIGTLLNPLMLVLGVFSLLFVMLLLLVGIGLVFFAF